MIPFPSCSFGPLAAVVLSVVLASAACGSDNDSSAPLSDPAAAADAALNEADADLDLNVISDAAPVIKPVETTTTVPRPVQGLIVDPYTLSIDECFDHSEDLTSGRVRKITSRLDCSTPHQFQIFGRLDYPAAAPSYYPGNDIMEDYARSACYQRFWNWSDSAYETSALEIWAFTPNRENFEPPTNYRGVQCYVERFDRELLVDSARGAGL